MGIVAAASDEMFDRLSPPTKRGLANVNVNAFELNEAGAAIEFENESGAVELEMLELEALTD